MNRRFINVSTKIREEEEKKDYQFLELTLSPTYVRIKISCSLQFLRRRKIFCPVSSAFALVGVKKLIWTK